MKLSPLAVYLILAAAVALASAEVLPAAQSGTAAAKGQMVNLELKDTQIKDAIDILFKGRGLNYTIDPSVVGKVVELRITGVSFRQALDALCEAAGLTCTLTDGVYKICPEAATGAGPRRTVVETGTAPPQTHYVPPPRAEAAQAATAAEAEPAGEQARPADRANTVVVSQTASPVYYVPPSDVAYGSQGGVSFAGVPLTRVGNVGFVGGGWGAPVLVGGPSLFWTREYPPPPPAGYVSPEVQRFLQAQYAITSRQYIVPIW